MYQQDWLCRQIQMLVQFIARLIFRKDNIEYRVLDPYGLTEADRLYYEIERLLAESGICEAENLLFEKIDTGDEKYLELAVDFYQKVNALSDKELQDADFSREEIQTGLIDIMRMFGLPTISYGGDV